MKNNILIKICELLTNHKFETKIATDWNKIKTVSTPVCLHCGVKNKNYDFNDDNNKFYLKYYNLYRKENFN